MTFSDFIFDFPIVKNPKTKPYVNVASPFIQWVGGKRSLLEKYDPIIPVEFNNYYEPFLGGGSVALNVKANEYRLGDKNEELIGMHRILASYSDSESLLKDIQNRLDAFGISSSFFGADVDPALPAEPRAAPRARAGSLASAQRSFRTASSASRRRSRGT